MLYQANAPTLIRCNFLKHIPKLIIFGTHNLHTFRHNTLINELLLMQFYLFNIRPKLHHWKWRKLRVTLPVNMHALFSVCSLRDDNVITSKPTWKLKHANSILAYFEYFCQISSKSILIIFSHTVSKLVRFWDRVYLLSALFKWLQTVSSRCRRSLGNLSCTRSNEDLEAARVEDQPCRRSTAAVGDGSGSICQLDIICTRSNETLAYKG